MKRAYLPVLAAIGIVAALLLVSFFSGYPQAQGTNSVCIKGACFRVEIAATADQRARGLMYRESLDYDRGMLFVYASEGLYQFWMKNTLIPLDIIWIGSDNRIVNIKRNAEPCGAVSCPTINPGADSLHVLEINGGLSDALGFEVGDGVEFRINWR